MLVDIALLRELLSFRDPSFPIALLARARGAALSGCQNAPTQSQKKVAKDAKAASSNWHGHIQLLPFRVRPKGGKVSPAFSCRRHTRPLRTITVLASHFEVSTSRATVIVRLPFRICLQAIRRDRVETFTSAEPPIMSVVARYEGDNILMSKSSPSPNKLIRVSSLTPPPIVALARRIVVDLMEKLTWTPI